MSAPQKAIRDRFGTDKSRLSVKTKPALATKKKLASKSCRLFTIPAELRIRIFSYALVEEDRIDVDTFLHGPRKSRTRLPGLLAACRQTRSEAIKIYYNQNSFVYHAHRFDLAPVLPFCKLLRKYHKNKKVVLLVEICRGLHGCGFDEWEIDTLDDWLEMYHTDPTSVPKPAQDTDANPLMARTVAERTFGVVESMLHKPWSSVSEVLEPFYEAIINLGNGDIIRFAEYEGRLRAQNRAKKRCLVPSRDKRDDDDVASDGWSEEESSDENENDDGNVYGLNDEYFDEDVDMQEIVVEDMD